MSAKTLIASSLDVLRRVVSEECAAPAWRAKQLVDSLYGKRRARAIEDMELLPREMRRAMEDAGWSTGRLDVVKGSLGRDGAGKISVRVGERELVEAVGIPDASCYARDGSGEVLGRADVETMFRGVDGWDKNRLTACVSSQVGCAMKCSFCATGLQGFKRNLSASEIVSQVLELEELYGKRVSDVVFMGMGEPMLNMKAVVGAIRCLNEDIGIGGRHITVSTVGIPNSLAKLAKEKLQATLAISLHAPDQETRLRIVPSAKHYPYEDLLDDVKMYFRETGRRVTFEYTLLAGVNDSPSQAQALSRILKRKFGAGAHLNVIPWNSIEGVDHVKPSRNAVHRFCGALGGISHTIRRTRGDDVSAACGMLTGDFERRSLGRRSMNAEL